MSESKHTKGPREVEDHDHDGYGMGLVYTPKGFLCKVIGDSAETKANANLIAKAPEMLELLKQLEFPNSYNGYDEGYCCCFCQNTEEQGHSPDCKLGKLLKEVER